MSGDRDHNYPYKFNHVWLKDHDFTQMVKKVWPLLQPANSEDDMCILSQNLRMLKKELKVWTRNKTSEIEKDSHILDLEIRALLTFSTSSILSLDG